MASTDQTRKNNDGKPQLSKAEMDSLVAATRESEEELREIYQQLVKDKFPLDGMTEEQFRNMMTVTTSTIGNSKLDVAKILFKIVDRDNSGEIQLYEFILAVTLLGKTDNPEIITKCLFNLCDADRDGFLTQDEIVGFAFILEEMDADRGDEKQNNGDNELNEIKSAVSKAFGGKKHISEKAFHQMVTENKEIQGFARLLQFIIALGIAQGGPGTGYGTKSGTNSGTD